MRETGGHCQHRKEDGCDAHGKPIIFDEGHKGLKLQDFVEMARRRGVVLTLVEMGVVRMYTGELFRPWNNALRGLDANGDYAVTTLSMPQLQSLS